MSQTTIVSEHIIIGVDTHKDTHAAVAIDSLGGRLDDYLIPVNLSGYQQLLEWAKAFEQDLVFGIEGSGSYGSGLTRFLQRQGFKVVEVGRPCYQNSRRLQGKDDLLDAEQAARQVLSGQATSIPKSADGVIEMMRLIKVAKDTAVKAQTQAMVSLKATLITADEELRSKLEPLPNSKLIKACLKLETHSMDTPADAMRHALAALAKRWSHLHKEIAQHTQHLITLTQATVPALVQAIGIGPDTAAQMLITLGDNVHRIRSEAAFAKMCGVCPLPASSGKTRRHRLNRGGNRQANASLFRVVIVRMRCHEPTKAYVARRQAEGLSKREIIRCLKRYLAREIFQEIRKSHIFPEAARS